MMPGSSTLVKIGAVIGGLVLLYLALQMALNEAYSRGAEAKDAEWARASARIQAASARAAIAQTKLSMAQEAKDAAEIKELKDEAAKGDDSTVGPGVRAVLDRLRDQARR